MSDKPMKYIALILLSVSLAGLNGCLAIGHIPKKEQPTLGQELIDLKKAREVEAISEEEYDRLRRELLDE